jgi:hypothetical protein
MISTFLEHYCAILRILKPYPIVLFLCCGCASYKVSTQDFGDSSCELYVNQNKEAALSHWLYHFIPRHRCQIQWYDIGHWTTWSLFGNDDDGIFGEELTAYYRPQQSIGIFKAIRWNLRNPFHNFCFYVIGSAYSENSEFIFLKCNQYQIEVFKYKNTNQSNFGGDQTSFLLALHGGKPFISLRLAYSEKYKGDFYLGWRERGNFGIKCTPFSKRKDCQENKRCDILMN